MPYLLYDIVNGLPEIFADTNVAPVMVLISQEDADAGKIDDRFLREPIGQNFQGSTAPWHYMMSVSEFFGTEGSAKLTCVSKDIFKTLWQKCPDKRHSLYGGEAKKEQKDLRPRNKKSAPVSEDLPKDTDDSLGGPNYTEEVFSRRKDAVAELLLKVAARLGNTIGWQYHKYTNTVLTEDDVQGFIAGEPKTQLLVDYGQDKDGKFKSRYVSGYAAIKEKLDAAFTDDPNINGSEFYTDLTDFAWVYDAENKTYTRVETESERKNREKTNG